MAKWYDWLLNPIGTALSGGKSTGFTKMLSDPLGYGDKEYSQQLAHDQFEFQKESFKQQQENWNKEFGLQNQQFEYQKWFDANGRSLDIAQLDKAGINPIAALGGAGSSSVSASASPQSPSAGSSPLPGGSSNGILGLLETILAQSGANKRAKESYDLQQQALDNEYDLKSTQLDNEKSYQDGLLTILSQRAGNEATRTDAYKDLTDAQTRDILHELEIRVAGKYGKNSTEYKKLMGEVASTFGIPLSELMSERVDEYRDEHGKKLLGKALSGDATVESILDSQGYKDYAAYIAETEHRSPSPYEYAKRQGIKIRRGY